MTNKIILGVIVLVLAGGSIYFIKKDAGTQAPMPEVQNIEENEVIEEQQTASSTPTTPVQASLKDQLWSLFQKYLSYNKNLDLSGVKSTVYKVAEICNTANPSKECKERMSSAYSYGSALKKEEFVNIESDDRQAIISTNFWTEDSPEMKKYGRFRAIIFFIKMESGEWRMLSFSPFKGKIISTGEAPKQEIIDRALIYTKDTDADGLSDYEEECIFDPSDTSCQKTDPKKKDSDGDGLWDGVEKLM